MTTVAARPTQTSWCCVAFGLFLIEVDGEQRRAGVEGSSQGAHQSRQQTRDHQSPDSRRHHILDHQCKGSLRLIGEGSAVRIDH
jgi:hypothetical protein